MSVAVDEARQYRGLAEVFDLDGRESFFQFGARADALDKRALDGDRAVKKRGGGDGQNPTRAVEFHRHRFSQISTASSSERV